MEKPILKNEIKAEITTIGKVEDNILEAKEYALEVKDYYSKLVFTEEQKSDAEKERAGINKLVRSIEDYRKKIMAEFKKPIENFETTAKETEKILKETSAFVDVQIKNFETKEREIRKDNARKIYEDNIEELKEVISFEKIFNEKWLNKGSWKEDGTSPLIVKEITEIKDKVRSGLKAIEELHTEFELEVKNSFLENYDLTAAIFKNTQLQEQKKAFSKVEETKDIIQQEKVEEMLTNEVKEEPLEPTLTYTLKITAPLSKQKQLKEFLELNNMTYEKVN